MKHADNSKVSELEYAIHDPHEVWQKIRARVPGRHQHGHIRRALVVRKDQGSSAVAGDWLVPGLDNCEKIFTL